MKKITRRTLSFMLTLCLCLSLFSAAAPKAVAEDAEPDLSLSWSRAFGDDSLPEGSLTPEEIAFYHAGDEGKPEIVNVPREEVLSWWEEQESLPRTRYFEQYMPEKLQDLYPILDYAFAHSCSRFCVPTTTFTATDVAGGWKYLPLTYRINNTGLSTHTPAVFDLGGGKTLQYVTVTIKGMDKHGVVSEYQESLAAAREIVAGIPEGSSEYDKALYLYRWLTDNVRYFSDGEPMEYYDSEWNLLYDTLVKKDTVCAGYAEALYVLYNLAGIECFTVYGNLYMGGEWGGHVWNVAKIDGEYYQFDSTWDEGVQPAHYNFFGVSEETMQSFYPRLKYSATEEYCPPCTKDLPLPEAETPESVGAPEPGTISDGVYSQPYFDLELCLDDSWTVYSRKEINEEYYGGMDLGMDLIFRMGGLYTDLKLNRDQDDVEITLEQAPLVTWKDEECYDLETYLEKESQAMPEVLEKEYGMEDLSVQRFRTEICGVSYETLSVTGSLYGTSITQTFYCAERNGYYLVINITGEGKSSKPILTALLREPETEPDPLEEYTLSWSRAFRSSKLPEGSFTGAEIAFYAPDDEGGASIVNVSKKEVLRWWNEQETLPRARYFEQFMPENLAELYPVLDYALAHGYSRVCIPTTAFSGQEAAQAASWLRLCFRLNDNNPGALSVASDELEDGKSLDFVLLTLPGMDSPESLRDYSEALAAAREIVAGIPEGSSESEKALYLYCWLTDNLSVMAKDYYAEEHSALYYALVEHKAANNGHAEALYLLFNLAGIECIPVSGFTEDSTWLPRTWNLAEIDGQFCHFDSMLDASLTSESRLFFGISEEQMQAISPRTPDGPTEEYYPAVTGEISQEMDLAALLGGKLRPGSVENGVYSQPFFDLSLSPDESWKVYSREEIIAEYYGGLELDMQTLLRMGLPYMDLVVQRENDMVQIMLENAPVQTANGESSSDAKGYMDNVALTLPEVLSSTGMRNASVTRSQTEICGRSYEVLSLTGKIGWTRMNQTYYCTDRDGVFLTIVVVANKSGDCDGLMAELLGS